MAEQQNKKLLAACKLPAMLDLPKKLLPILFNLNKYSLFLCEGGRGSGKTHSVGRIILYVGEKRKVKVTVAMFGRETNVELDFSQIQKI